MKTFKIILAITLALLVLVSNIGEAFAAPGAKAGLLTGVVKSITLETDTSTAETTVLVTLLTPNNISQTLRLSVDNATALGLLTTDENGMPVINPNAIGETVQINPKAVLADEATGRHPVADALATFFADITDYNTIMDAHQNGAGFGVITQALWLTQKLQGDTEIFSAILSAKQTGDFSHFTLDDGTTPANWGQFKKAILEGTKKGTQGVVLSTQHKDTSDLTVKHPQTDQHTNGNNNHNTNDEKNKDKDKDKGNGHNK